MSEGPSVTLLGTEDELSPWWVTILPIHREGKKFQLNNKKLTYWAASGVTLFALTQIVLDGSTAQIPDKSPGFSAPVVQANTYQNIPEATGTPLQSTKKDAEPVARLSKFTAPEVILRPRALGMIPPGAMLEASLMSGASNGLVRAEVTKALTVNGEPIIPQGSYLVGSGSSSEERLFIRFNQVVFSDGTFGSLNAEACDLSDRIVGLKGSKINAKTLNLAGSLGLGFLGGFSTALQTTHEQNGAVITQPSLKNALLAGTATTALEESKNLMSDLKNRVPIIEVPKGTPICAIAVNQ